MKVIAFNGSPKKEGNTYHALQMVLEPIQAAGAEVEIITVGNHAISGCVACGGCVRNKNERCVIENDSVNEWIQKMKDADGIILGSPVHYAGIAGNMKSFLDRAFYVTSVNNGMLRHKVGASVAAVRRSGGVTTFEQLNNYLLYSEMFLPTANYWNVIHGARPGEVKEDTEGVQIMSVLGENMNYLLQMRELAKGQIEAPEKAAKVYMNFVR